MSTRAAIVAEGDAIPDGAVAILLEGAQASVLAALRAGALPRRRVLGAAGLAAARRLERLVAEALGVAEADVRALSPSWPRLCSVAGVPATELLSPQDLAKLLTRASEKTTREESAAAAEELAETVASGRRRLLPCSAYLDGEYGIHGLLLPVPAIVGPAGLERVVQLNLKIEERLALQKAAAAGRALAAELEVAP